MAFRVFPVFPVFFAPAVVFAAALFTVSVPCAAWGKAPVSAPVRDARFGWNFDYSVTIAKPSGEARVTVHYQTVGDEPLAEQAARLFTRLMRLHKEHFGMETRFFQDADSADVWLAGQRPETRNDGGDTRQNQMYIFGVHDVRRTKLEWTRTLVHEWGHLTLPAARGYTDPETDASGYLGERLYMKWLHDDTVAGSADPNDGTTPDDLNRYYARQIAPLMARFNRPESQGGGPNAPILLDHNTRAMDGYIGAVCAGDTSWGSPQTGRALFGILGTNARDYFASARTVWLEALKSPDPAPLILPAWVPLPKGTYSFKTEKNERKFSVAAPAWKWLDGTGSATLGRVAKP